MSVPTLEPWKIQSEKDVKETKTMFKPFLNSFFLCFGLTFSKLVFRMFWPLDAGFPYFWPEHEIPSQKLHTWTAGDV